MSDPSDDAAPEPEAVDTSPDQTDSDGSFLITRGESESILGSREREESTIFLSNPNDGPEDDA